MTEGKKDKQVLKLELLGVYVDRRQRNLFKINCVKRGVSMSEMVDSWIKKFNEKARNNG